MQPIDYAQEGGPGRALLKLASLAILVLLLLVPVTQLLGLVRERQSRQEEVRRELARMWGGEQTLGALMLLVPVRRAGDLPAAPATGWATFLPGAVHWQGVLEPEPRQRGLFAATVYEARLEASGWFARPAPVPGDVRQEQLDWDHAVALLGVSDPRGLQERPVLRWGDRARPFEPATLGLDQLGPGLQAPLAAGDLAAAGPQRLPFSFQLMVRGSEALRLLPLGDDTTAELSSPWSHPGFVGASLPRQRAAGPRGTGFTARWSVPCFGRGYPQQWPAGQLDAEHLRAQLEASAFGVSLVQLADPYQQTERAVKYAVLFILLTFTTVFVLELLSPVRLHPMHYLLVGAALCLFYLLLLALAEHGGMGRAYAAATTATVLLVTLYTRAVLAGTARATVVGAVLAGLYAWLYTLLRAEDYALLLGALGLFGSLAAVMFLTRRLDWATLRFRPAELG
ncbi:MAG TPA: cell envelope integrity protein CreD [Thermoanaerobaculia bacterium]|jgi:inner membrane protein|nr:cell envelope integrity protein CreD [Thermoanaerobaculia bacterium]